MANVIPSGTSEPWFWAAREAAANDALTRLFYSLMARREDRERNEELRRELADRHEQLARELQEARFGHDREMRSGGDANAPSKIVPPPTSGSGVKPPAPAQAPASTNAPTTLSPHQPKPPPTGGFSELNPAALNAYAQADDDEGDADLPFGARPVQYQRKQTQSKKPLGATPQPPAPTKKPRPYVSAYAEIPEEVREHWRGLEKKYGLPQGLLQTTIGLYHKGGRDDWSTPKPGSDALGWFGLSKELRDTFGVSDDDTKNIMKMSEVAAKNYKRNVDAFNSVAKSLNGKTDANGQPINLPPITATADNVPYWIMLNKLGPVDGPRAYLALQNNPNAPLSAVMAPATNPDGTPRDNSRHLLNLGIKAGTTVGDYFKGTYESTSQMHAATVQDESTYKQRPPAAPTPAAPSDGKPRSFLQDRIRSPEVNVSKLNPEFEQRIAHAVKVAEDALGLTGRKDVVSGYRSPELQAQLRANYIRRPVTYGGVTYTPKERGGLAAPPGRSRHQEGTATDIGRGPILDYFDKHPELLRSLGLERLRNDRPHIQMTRGRLPPMPATAVAAAAPNMPAENEAIPVNAMLNVAAKVAAPEMPSEALRPFNEGGPNALPDFKTRVSPTLGNYTEFGDPLPKPPPAAPQADTAAASQPTPQTLPPREPDQSIANVVPDPAELSPDVYRPQVVDRAPKPDLTAAPPLDVQPVIDEITGGPQLPIGSMLNEPIPEPTADEAGMAGIEQYVEEPSVPMAATDPNKDMAWIQQQAARYRAYKDEQNKNFKPRSALTTPPPTQAREPVVEPPPFDTSKLFPPASPYQPTDLDYQRQQAEALAQTPPQERASVPQSFTPDENAPIPPYLPNQPAPPPAQSFDPVERAKAIAAAIYGQGDTSERLPEGVSGASIAKDWIANLFKGKAPTTVPAKPSERVPSNPIRTTIPESGIEYSPAQPPIDPRIYTKPKAGGAPDTSISIDQIRKEAEERKAGGGSGASTPKPKSKTDVPVPVRKKRADGSFYYEIPD